MTDLELEVLEAQEAAENIECCAKQAAKEAYWALLAEIEAAWDAATKLGYITDACVDSQNSESEVYDSYSYWKLMYASAVLAVGFRAEEAGYNINKILGRSIY